MCFSAAASFTAAAALGAVGAATLAQKPRPRDVMFASIPLVFAAHQAIEGAIWLALHDGRAAPGGLVVAYLLIAQVVWPVYVPLCVIVMERRRRWALWLLLAAGLFVSGALALVLAQNRYTAEAVADGLRYSTNHEFEARLLGLYLIAVTAPLFLSRHRYVVAFGAATLLGSAVTMIGFYYASASVWCFFAAVASILVFFHVRAARRSAARLEISSTEIAAA
jgi:hypothetical protein